MLNLIFDDWGTLNGSWIDFIAFIYRSHAPLDMAYMDLHLQLLGIHFFHQKLSFWLISRYKIWMSFRFSGVYSFFFFFLQYRGKIFSFIFVFLASYSAWFQRSISYGFFFKIQTIRKTKAKKIDTGTLILSKK